MKSILHKANSRGHAHHGWLETHHTFSFANYYDPKRIHFGALRVLNDDRIAPGMGFGMHPHDNMEIVTIPLEGALKHSDNMGNTEVIEQGEVQVMSAGTGIFHSEFNASTNEDVALLQIWILPQKQHVTPRYKQKRLQNIEQENSFSLIVSPQEKGAELWIHQDAWFTMGTFSKHTDTVYQMHKKTNGIYAFIIEGSATICEHHLETRDGIGIWDSKTVEISAPSHSKMLLMEVPMNI